MYVEMIKFVGHIHLENLIYTIKKGYTTMRSDDAKTCIFHTINVFLNL
jgi:hypothetical protein